MEILCHLRDEETEDFGARVRVIAKRGKRFAPIDPERWAVERRYLEDDGPGALAAFRERRTASLAFLDTLKPERLTGRRAARAHRPAVGARPAGGVGGPRPPAYRPARGHAGARVGRTLGAAARGVRRARFPYPTA